VTPEKGSSRENQSLIQAGRNVGHLLHQLRPPLATIGLLADSIRERSELDEQARSDLGQIIEHVSKLESALEGCLGYMRPTSKANERVDVAGLIRWLASAIIAQAEQVNVPIVADVPSDLPDIPGHRRLLQQAMLNEDHGGLIVIGSTPGKGTHVTIRLPLAASEAALRTCGIEE